MLSSLQSAIRLHLVSTLQLDITVANIVYNYSLLYCSQFFRFPLMWRVGSKLLLS